MTKVYYFRSETDRVEIRPPIDQALIQLAAEFKNGYDQGLLMPGYAEFAPIKARGPTSLASFMLHATVALEKTPGFGTLPKAKPADVLALEQEITSLRMVLNEWLDKTSWLQEAMNSNVLNAKYLGLHRADVMKELIYEHTKTITGPAGRINCYCSPHATGAGLSKDEE
jgi:hypothetical protein